MMTRIQKWGNSQGLRLAKQVLAEACLSVGDDVEVAAQDGKIVIAPVRKPRVRLSLKELVSRIPKDVKPGEIRWGQPVGREEW